MRRIEALLRFLWDFVVGDDWRIAVAVAIALGVTALVAGTTVSAWWILPAIVAVLLGYSLRRAAHHRATPDLATTDSAGEITAFSGALTPLVPRCGIRALTIVSPSDI